MTPLATATRRRVLWRDSGGAPARLGLGRNALPARETGSLALARTVVLGCIAAALGIWWLGRAYEVDNDELFGYLWSSIAFVALVAILGVAGAAALWLVRRRRK